MLCAGSVLHYRLGQPPAPEQLERLRGGVGEHTEAGLGVLLANPVLLADARPRFAPAPAAPKETEAGAPRPDDPLLDWLEERVRGDGAALRRQVREIANRYADVLAETRRYFGLPDDAPVGPSASQFGALAEEARRQRDAAALRTRLFDDADGYCSRNREGWKDELYADGRKTTAGGWLRAQLEGLDDARLPAFVRQLGMALRETVVRDQRTGASR